MELLVGALAVVALIAIAIRFAPRNASGGVVLPGVVDESIGMWGIRAVTRRIRRGPAHAGPEALDDIPLDTLEARLGTGRPADAPASGVEPAPPLVATSAAATAAARVTRPPSVVEASAEATPANLATEAPEPDQAASRNGTSAAGADANGTGPSGTGGKRSRRRKGTGGQVGEGVSPPPESDVAADDATAGAGLAAAATAADAGPAEPGPSSETIAHDPAGTNGAALRAGSNGNALTAGTNGHRSADAVAGTDPSAPDASAAASASYAAFSRTVPLIVGSRPIGTWSKSPESLPTPSWGSTSSPASSTTAVAPTSPADETSENEAAGPADPSSGRSSVPLPAGARQASTRFGLSVRSMSILIGAVLLVVALVLAAQVDKKHEAVLSATGLPGDGVAGAGSPPPAAGSAAPSGPARSGAPGKSPKPSPAGPSVPPPPTGMPAFSRSALIQAVLLDQRLTADRAALRAALAASPFDASGVAAILRNVSADSVYGLQLAPIVASWQPSEQLGLDLRDAYDAIHQEAANTLAQSVQLASTYRQSAKAMVTQLAALKAIDDRARALADANGAADLGTSPAP